MLMLKNDFNVIYLPIHARQNGMEKFKNWLCVKLYFRSDSRKYDFFDIVMQTYDILLLYIFIIVWSLIHPFSVLVWFYMQILNPQFVCNPFVHFTFTGEWSLLIIFFVCQHSNSKCYPYITGYKSRCLLWTRNPTSFTILTTTHHIKSPSFTR